MKKFLLAFIGIISSNAYASCGGQFDPATGTCRFIDSSGKEVLYNSAPPSSRARVQQNVENITIDLPSKYGALARSLKTGGFGSARNKNSKAAAVKTAIARCESVKGNGKCVYAGYVRNGCHALSIGRKGNSYKTYYSAGDQYTTEAIVMKKCQKAGEKGCEILMPEECSLPEIPN